MKTTFKSEETRKLNYRNYSSIFQKNFNSDLLLNNGDGKSNFLEFDKKLVETLDKHVSKKTTKIRRSNRPTLTKH